MPNNEEKNRIEKLKDRLYSKKDIIRRERSQFPRKIYDVKVAWEDKDNNQVFPDKNDLKKMKKKTFLEKTLVAAVIFFLISAIVVFVAVFGGATNVSSDNVEISVTGPSTIESGGELLMQVSIKNNNSVDLELADLIIEYPEGTHSASGDIQDLNSVRESMDIISAGKSVRKEYKSILYGEENSEKDIVISLEYRIAGSNAIFFKDRKYEIKISSSPINLIVSPLKEVISGQDIELSVSVVSNTPNEINDLLVSIEYPFGFEFKSASPEPEFGNNVWKIKSIDSSSQNVIKIKGTITGQDDEERVFKFSSGTRDFKNEKEIGALFASVTKSLLIKKPFLGIDIALNGDTSATYVSQRNKSIRVDVMWSNNSPATIIDGEILIKLKGDILDKSSISVDKGFYRSFDNTIVWNKTTSGELSEINSGEGGRFSFSFSPLSLSAKSGFVDPEILINVSAKGNRISENETPEEVISTVSKVVKISSDLMIAPRATYYTGPFVNTGSIPPKVDKETTYTITLTVTNTTNNVSDVKVSLSLPAYVRWMGVVSPTSENISYNSIGGEIVWNIGDVKPGAGTKEVYFQVALLPSISQVGESPKLTSDIVMEGIDQFTNAIIRKTEKGVSTTLNTDSGFTGSGDARVVQ
ncbi:hypothetical protein KKG48_02650 [Patescibacteria group bacterium]|nr:hypothetical protein [Patescibacteria group bacterium]MCG2695008.1 hypothetical protein [Candidatus Parcubacteria bacterium]